MKLRRLVPVIASLSLSLGVAACEKSDDVPHIQEEANGLVAAYAAEFDEMQQRSVWLQERSASAVELAGPRADASPRLRAANQRLGALRAEVQQAPAEIANAAKTSRDATQAKLDQLHHTFRDGALIVRGELDEAEAFLERVEEAATAVAMGPANQEPPPAQPAVDPAQPTGTPPTPPTPPAPTQPAAPPTEAPGAARPPQGTPPAVVPGGR